MSHEQYVIKVKILIKEELKKDILDLLTRQTGERILQRIETEIKNIPEEGTLVLDFAGVGVIDYSCADEVIAKLISRLQLDEYGPKYLALQNLSSTQKENIQVALERKNLAVLENENGEWAIVGSVNDYLLKTLQAVMKKGLLSSSELSELLKLELNTASTRLINLHKLRLVKKTPSTDTENGKRHFVYKSLLS